MTATLKRYKQILHNVPSVEHASANQSAKFPNTPSSISSNQTSLTPPLLVTTTSLVNNAIPTELPLLIPEEDELTPTTTTASINKSCASAADNRFILSLKKMLAQYQLLVEAPLNKQLAALSELDSLSDIASALMPILTSRDGHALNFLGYLNILWLHTDQLGVNQFKQLLLNAYHTTPANLPANLTNEQKAAVANSIDCDHLIQQFKTWPCAHNVEQLHWLRHQLRLKSFMATIGGEAVAPATIKAYLSHCATVLFGSKIGDQLPDDCLLGSVESIRSLAKSQQPEVLNWLAEEWFGKQAIDFKLKNKSIVRSIDFYLNKSQFKDLFKSVDSLSNSFFSWLCRCLAVFSSSIKREQQTMQSSINTLTRLTRDYLKHPSYSKGQLELQSLIYQLALDACDPNHFSIYRQQLKIIFKQLIKLIAQKRYHKLKLDPKLLVASTEQVLGYKYAEILAAKLNIDAQNLNSYTIHQTLSEQAAYDRIRQLHTDAKLSLHKQQKIARLKQQFNAAYQIDDAIERSSSFKAQEQQHINQNPVLKTCYLQLLEALKDTQTLYRHHKKGYQTHNSILLFLDGLGTLVSALPLVGNLLGGLLSSISRLVLWVSSFKRKRKKSQLQQEVNEKQGEHQAWSAIAEYVARKSVMQWQTLLLAQDANNDFYQLLASQCALAVRKRLLRGFKTGKANHLIAQGLIRAIVTRSQVVDCFFHQQRNINHKSEFDQHYLSQIQRLNHSKSHFFSKNAFVNIDISSQPADNSPQEHQQLAEPFSGFGERVVEGDQMPSEVARILKQRFDEACDKYEKKLDEKDAQLSDTQSQLSETQSQLSDTQSQLCNTQSQLEILQSSQKEKERRLEKKLKQQQKLYQQELEARLKAEFEAKLAAALQQAQIQSTTATTSDAPEDAGLIQHAPLPAASMPTTPACVSGATTPQRRHSSDGAMSAPDWSDSDVSFELDFSPDHSDDEDDFDDFLRQQAQTTTAPPSTDAAPLNTLREATSAAPSTTPAPAHSPRTAANPSLH